MVDAIEAGSARPDADSIPVELGGVTRFVPLEEVRYAEAQGDYARLHTATGSHLIRTPLTTLEEDWRDSGFVRIHRSLLVALAHVDEVRLVAGRCTVVVGDQELTGQPPAHPRAARRARAAGPSRRERAVVTEPPRRVRVTSPRTGATRQRRVTGASEIDAQTDIGEIYMTSLLRSQLRLAVLVLLALVVLVAGLPVLFVLAPGARWTRRSSACRCRGCCSRSRLPRAARAGLDLRAGGRAQRAGLHRRGGAVVSPA